MLRSVPFLEDDDDDESRGFGSQSNPSVISYKLTGARRGILSCSQERLSYVAAPYSVYKSYVDCGVACICTGSATASAPRAVRFDFIKAAIKNTAAEEERIIKNKNSILGMARTDVRYYYYTIERR